MDNPDEPEESEVEVVGDAPLVDDDVRVDEVEVEDEVEDEVVEAEVLAGAVKMLKSFSCHMILMG